jgi:hypothetical protein
MQSKHRIQCISHVLHFRRKPLVPNTTITDSPATAYSDDAYALYSSNTLTTVVILYSLNMNVQFTNEVSIDHTITGNTAVIYATTLPYSILNETIVPAETCPHSFMTELCEPVLATPMSIFFEDSAPMLTIIHILHPTLFSISFPMCNWNLSLFVPALLSLSEYIKTSVEKKVVAICEDRNETSTEVHKPFVFSVLCRGYHVYHYRTLFFVSKHIIMLYPSFPNLPFCVRTAI